MKSPVFKGFSRKTPQRIAAFFLAAALATTAFGTWRELLLAYRETPVEQAAIDLPQTKEVCNHHPEGCPKDCFCPKTKVHLDAPVKEISAPASSLYESSWVNCNEEGSGSSAPLHAVFLPAAAPGIYLNARRVASIAAADPGRERAFSAPLQKIPIV